MRYWPCSASIQPGYSCGSGLISSSAFRSSAISCTRVEARLSRNCRPRLRADDHARDTPACASSQASAICATETPCRSAIGRMASTQRNARSLSTIGKSKLARRAPVGPCRSGLNLPLSSPPASGLQTINPSFWSSSSGTTSRSRSASRDRVVGLHTDEFSQPALLGYPERLHDLPGGHVAQADIAHPARSHQIVQRRQRLLERRQRIESVQLVQIDVIELQALQARIDLVEQMMARLSAAIRLSIHDAGRLGGDDELVRAAAEVLQRLPDRPSRTRRRNRRSPCR